MKINKTTPVFCVTSIEESLPFWTNTLGYEKTVGVPHHDVLGFVILKKDGSEVMLQTHKSLTDDLPEIAKIVGPGASLHYSDVDSIDETLKALKDAKLLVPLRTTFYGAKEVFVQDRDGNILGFAEHR